MGQSLNEDAIRQVVAEVLGKLGNGAVPAAAASGFT